MEIENIKKVTLTDYETDSIGETFYMIKKIADEFDNYTRLEVFERLLDHYDRNEGGIDNEIDF